MQNFILTGIAGYVAPRHLKAIKETGSNLLAAFDPHDSVGILDSYFPKADYFHEFERFERHIVRLNKSAETRIDYMTICSPNHIHDAQIRLGLNNGMNIICEKPLVLFPHNLDSLEDLEQKSGKKVSTVMQLRYHPAIINLKEKLSSDSKRKNVTLTYITSRGNWYNYSWKGNEEKSGGIATNIGIHLFDLMIYLFGGVKNSEVNHSEINKMSGCIELEKADVVWYLSIDENDLPTHVRQKGKTSFREIIIDNHEIEFSEGFTDLHTQVYREVLGGKGMGIPEARSSIELVHSLRTSKAVTPRDLIHPLLKKD